MSNSLPALFTPQVNKGDGTLRYILYRHQPKIPGAMLVSASLEGLRFMLRWEEADCGLDCKCAASITWVSKAGAKQLASAKTIFDPNAYVEEESEEVDA